jgi:hypothetical protein
MHLNSFYRLFYYKYFAALPLSDNLISDVFHIFSFINNWTLLKLKLTNEYFTHTFRYRTINFSEFKNHK